MFVSAFTPTRVTAMMTFNVVLDGQACSLPPHLLLYELWDSKLNLNIYIDVTTQHEVELILMGGSYKLIVIINCCHLSKSGTATEINWNC